MDKVLVDRYYWYKKIAIVIGILLFLSCVVIINVDAAQTYNSSVVFEKATTTSLTWNVTYKGVIRATGATLDGVAIEGYDLSHDVMYTATGLEPNSTHKFCIYRDLINCDTATTLPDSTDIFYKYAGLGLLILLAIGFIYVSKYEKMLGLGALVIGGIISGMTFSEGNIVGLTIGLVIIFSSIFITFKGD